MTLVGNASSTNTRAGTIEKETSKLFISCLPVSWSCGYGSLSPLPNPFPVSSICLGFTSLMGASTMLQAPISPSRTMRAGSGSSKNTHRWCPFDLDVSTPVTYTHLTLPTTPYV